MNQSFSIPSNHQMIKPFSKGRDEVLNKEWRCPPDKSITHRSVLFASMAQGESQILSPLLGADCRSTISAFRKLGVEIEEVSDQSLVVRSPGWDAWKSPLTPLDFGNSGTTARLLTGVFAATPGLFVSCFGDDSLSQRPMGRVVVPLRTKGAQILGRSEGKLLPLAIEGRILKSGMHEVDKASAQVKSALILAGLNITGETTVRLPSGGRDHTEKMLKALGASIHVSKDVKGFETISVQGPFRPLPRTYRVTGDPSSAAFLAALGALSSGKVKILSVLDNPTRSGFLTILERFGVRIEKSLCPFDANSLEPCIDLTITGGSRLKAVDMEPGLAPTLIDEIPILAVVAIFAEGVSRFRGLDELRVKESDRLQKTIELLNLAGAHAYAEGNDLIVEGGLKNIKSFQYNPDWDHRLAMAAGVLAKFATADCAISDPECVKVSFPGFFSILANL